MVLAWLEVERHAAERTSTGADPGGTPHDHSTLSTASHSLNEGNPVEKPGTKRLHPGGLYCNLGRAKYAEGLPSCA